MKKPRKNTPKTSGEAALLGIAEVQPATGQTGIVVHGRKDDWVRVSYAEQQSMERQIELCREYCRLHGLTLVDVGKGRF